MKVGEREALDRLIDLAQGDTGQSGEVADFLLAWWNATAFGGFDLTTLWKVDAAIARDMVTVCGLISREAKYPDNLGYKSELAVIIKQWRSGATS